MFFFKKQWTCHVCGGKNKGNGRFCFQCGTEKKVHRDSYDAFISYRMDKGSEAAVVIQLELEKFGKSAFLDVTELQVGRFDEKLLEVIENSHSFILVLSEKCLDRCVNKTDWLKREIVHALEKNKRIIPVQLTGFSFPDENTFSLLPDPLRVIPKLQAIEYSHINRNSSVRKIVEAMAADHKRCVPKTQHIDIHDATQEIISQNKREPLPKKIPDLEKDPEIREAKKDINQVETTAVESSFVFEWVPVLGTGTERGNSQSLSISGEIHFHGMDTCEETLKLPPDAYESFSFQYMSSFSLVDAVKKHPVQIIENGMTFSIASQEPNPEILFKTFDQKEGIQKELSLMRGHVQERWKRGGAQFDQRNHQGWWRRKPV